MLNNITLENFKGFKKLDNLKIKPITILCGPNSCGKTSILQSILLLKQTLESKNPNQTLLLNGRFVKLGYFKDLIYQKRTSNEVTLDLCFNISPDIYRVRETRRPPIGFYLRDIIGRSYNINENSEFLIDYRISLKTTSNEVKESEYLKSLKVTNVCIKIIEKQEQKKEIISTITITKKSEDNYNVNWQKKNNSGQVEAKIKFANLFPLRMIFSEDGRKNSDRINFFLLSLNHLFQIIFQSYTYLGPLRGEPKKRYIYEDEVVEIGNTGENAAYLYLVEKDFPIKNHFFYNSKNDDFIKTEVTDIKSALNKWFELMQIKDFEAKILNKIIYLNLSASSFDSTQVGIADVGFGVSQIFPIILEGLRMDTGSTLLLEQPEIHLHPNLQMQLSDYFISLALSGKNVIAETHSDHIINRLVRRIVEDDKYNLKEKIGIYFIKSTDEGSVYEEINIDDMRGITNWPVNFFDQTANEQMKIMQAGIKKRRNLRNSKKQ